MAGGISAVGQHKQTELWVSPVVSALAACVVAAGSLFIDSRFDLIGTVVPVFSGHPDTARTLLSVIAGSVTTLLALIFTIIVVAIQLASSQYSPRTLATLLQDRPSHFTIGVFVGTFTYTVIILLGLNYTIDEENELASGLSMTLAFVFAVVSLATFAVYSNHIIHSVRITSLINRIGGETRGSIERLYQDDFAGDEHPPIPDRDPDHLVRARRAGILTNFDVHGLVDAASRSDSLIVLPIIGGYIPEGAVIGVVYGADPGDVADAIELSKERAVEHDVLFGLRQLSDMAVRANSTGINDPATAVQVIDELHDAVRRLAGKNLQRGLHYDADGNLRLVAQMPSWQDVLNVAVEEIRLAGGSSLQVVRRLRAMLEDLLEVVPEPRRPSIERQIELLDATVEREFDDEHVRELARRADIRGTGF